MCSSDLYLVMLDADDEIVPEFIETTMAALSSNKEFLYTDLRFIGDAFHTFETEEFKCEALANHHQHPCTFLAETAMYRAIYDHRSFCYDESVPMRTGYEDWEFSVAAMEAGYCGRRVPGHLFHYRFHQNGSMRTRARPLSGQLSRYIQVKHPWLTNKQEMEKMCAGCCGNQTKYFKKTGLVAVSKLGDVKPDEPLVVTYTGPTTSTMTKVGGSQRIYKYSGNPNGTFGPTFTIVGTDAHLFSSGPYIIRRAQEFVTQEMPPPPKPMAVVTASPKPTTPPPPPPPVTVVKAANHSRTLSGMSQEQIEQRMGMMDEAQPDDFTVLGLTSEQASALVMAGYALYDDLADASVMELSAILKYTREKSEKLKSLAKEVVDEINSAGEEDAGK